jgi:glutamate-1-semialdehyde 2,1-aminomutase
LLVFDEMISGFRWHLNGAQHYFGVMPDMATFGKAIGNGFSVAALTGRRDVMELGGLTHQQRRCFLLSATHGGETHALAACLKTLEVIESCDVVGHIWRTGQALMDGLRDAAMRSGFEQYVDVVGYPCSPLMVFRDADGEVSMPIRTLWLQEMVARGVLMPYIAISYAHDDSAIDETVQAAAESFSVCLDAIGKGEVAGRLEGEPTKPVFREYN